MARHICCALLVCSFINEITKVTKTKLDIIFSFYYHLWSWFVLLRSVNWFLLDLLLYSSFLWFADKAFGKASPELSSLVSVLPIDPLLFEPNYKTWLTYLIRVRFKKKIQCPYPLLKYWTNDVILDTHRSDLQIVHYCIFFISYSNKPTCWILWTYSRSRHHLLDSVLKQILQTCPIFAFNDSVCSKCSVPPVPPENLVNTPTPCLIITHQFQSSTTSDSDHCYRPVGSLFTPTFIYCMVIYS